MTLSSTEIIENRIILLMFISTFLFIFVPKLTYSFLKKINIATYMDNISFALLIIAAAQPILFAMSWDGMWPIPIIKNTIIFLVLPIWVLARSRHIKIYGEINKDYKPDIIQKIIKVAQWELKIFVIFIMILIPLILFLLSHIRVG